MNKYLVVLVSVLLTLLFVVSVHSEDMADGQEIRLQDIGGEDAEQIFFGSDDSMNNEQIKAPVYPPGEGVEFKHVFPKNPFKSFVNGELAELLINVINNGHSTQHVMSIRGYLMNPMNDSMIASNLTAYRYTVSVAPGEQATVKYWFKPMFEAGQVPMEVSLDCYDGANMPFKLVAFKDTIQIADAETVFDLQSLFLVIILTIVGFVALFLSYESLVLSNAPGAKKNKNGSGLIKVVEKVAEFAHASQERRVSNDSNQDDADDDWIPDHVKNIESQQSKKAGGNNKKGSKKSK